MDSAELSFVRCPACRSLVPATSNRCRMCGSSLETVNGDATKKPEEQKNGRVRQQTSLEDDGNVSQAIEKIRTDAVTPPPPPAATPSTSVSAEAASEVIADEGEDPLRAYLEDFDEDKNEEDDDIDDLFDGDDEDEDEDDDDAIDDPIAALEAENKDEPVAAAPVPVEEVPEPVKPQPRPAKEALTQTPSRVVVEQGSKKSGSLSFGGRAESKPAPGPKTPAPTARTQPAPQPVKPAHKPQPQPQARKPEPSRKQASSVPGKLFGWLVSFASPEGAAIELREGRFFVSSSNVRGGDLVLIDDSISSPHALVVVSAEDGVTAQDLVSDAGVFVCRHGSTQYRQEIETFRLFHGDHLRFGNVEFVVSLLPEGV